MSKRLLKRNKIEKEKLSNIPWNAIHLNGIQTNLKSYVSQHLIILKNDNANICASQVTPGAQRLPRKHICLVQGYGKDDEWGKR